jgi:hypothetical protein
MRKIVVVAAVAALAGCASAPTGPSVMVLPGKGKSTEQFQAEDTKCRQMATSELATTKSGNVPAQRRYDMTYMQCMYSQGNQIPALNRPGYSTPYGSAPATSTTVTPPGASTPPPPPAGTPPPPPPSR